MQPILSSLNCYEVDEMQRDIGLYPRLRAIETACMGLTLGLVPRQHNGFLLRTNMVGRLLGLATEKSDAVRRQAGQSLQRAHRACGIPDLEISSV